MMEARNHWKDNPVGPQGTKTSPFPEGTPPTPKLASDTPKEFKAWPQTAHPGPNRTPISQYVLHLPIF